MYITLGIIIVLFFVAVAAEKAVIPYMTEMKVIKMEIKRACSKGEKAYWEHKSRSLKRRYIPLYSVLHRKKKH